MADPAVDASLWSNLLLSITSGALTAVHPCPFTTNIAAISVITAWAGSWRRCLKVAGAFVAGFSGAYLLMGLVIALIGQGIEAWAGDIATISQFFLGPTLVLVGMLQLELIKVPDFGAGGNMLKQRLQQKTWSVWGAAGLGFLLALAFCPATAGLFFGVLLPHILASGSNVLLPVGFGFGAALPLAICAVIVAANPMAFRKGSRWQHHLRIGSGVLLVVVGVYRCLVDLIL